MYYYIVDAQNLKQREFERVQNILYSSLSEYGIAGEVVRITGVRSVTQLVENAFSHEAKTIVAVGSDETLHETINAIGKREITVGYIPLMKSLLAQTLGIKDIVQACKTIALRRIEAMDMGSVNGNYFLSKLSFGSADTTGIRNWLNAPTFEIKFSVNGSYHASQVIVGGQIINCHASKQQSRFAYPKDGALDLVLIPELSKWQIFQNFQNIRNGMLENLERASIIHGQKIEITFPIAMPLRMGKKVLCKAPAAIETLPKALKFIVGKERKL